MRLLQKKYSLDFVSISGEIDKSGHSKFKEIDQRNPDFIFHEYGSFENNEFIIEVKGCLKSKRGIIKDFKTINLFCLNYSYKRGYFILYNHSLDEFKTRVNHWLKTDNSFFYNLDTEITIICKRDSYSPCEVETLESFLENCSEQNEEGNISQ